MTLCGSLSRWAVRLGATLHEAGYRAVGLDWRYVPFETEDLAGALTGMRALGIRGFGVSMPFKRDILPLLDTIDPLAARIGAVNTVVNDGGTLTGHNTDWVGATRALEEVIALDGTPVLVLGAGGAARAVVVGLRERGADVTVCNRSDHNAAAIAGTLEVKARSWDERQALDGFEVLVNASSAGMRDVDPRSPIAAAALHADLCVMDIVYKPLDTALLRAAAKAGARTIHGGRMLLHQAARQFELYTGVAAPLDAMGAALDAALLADPG